MKSRGGVESEAVAEISRRGEAEAEAAKSIPRRGSINIDVKTKKYEKGHFYNNIWMDVMSDIGKLVSWY